MDNEASVSDVPNASLPRAQPFDATASRTQNLTTYVEPTHPSEGRVRTGVFSHLVKDDSDIAGLVAYYIYKQHKLDWLRAFEGVKGRPPNDDELASYFIGEGTPRRIATYRHLAEATLSGQGPEVGGVPGTMGDGARRDGARRDSAWRRRSAGLADRPLAPGLVAVYALIAVLFVIGFWLALHYTMSSR